MADIPDPSASLTEAHRWLAKAREDLTVASIVLGSESSVNWAACFHAQQASEKAIKALLVASGIDFPRTHALDRLLALLPSDQAHRFDLDSLDELAPWAVAGRYPEDIANPDGPTATRLVNATRDTLEIAARILSGGPNG